RQGEGRRRRGWGSPRPRRRSAGPSPSLALPACRGRRVPCLQGRGDDLRQLPPVALQALPVDEESRRPVHSGTLASGDVVENATPEGAFAERLVGSLEAELGRHRSQVRKRELLAAGEQ